jgi:glycosyltransferase involved in cell wall biosynthesis
MRILHTESSRNFGGQELRVIEEMEWFRKLGHQVWLAAAPDSGIDQVAQRHGIRCLPIPFRGSINLVVIARLIGFCLKNRVELIVSRSSRDMFNTAIVSLLTRIPMIRYRHIGTSLKDSFIYRLAWRAPRRIVATSEDIKHRLLHHQLVPPEKIEILGEYVNFTLFHPEISSTGVRAAHGIPEDATLIGQFGMIRPDKGQKYLALAVDEILEKHPNCWFMFVGSATEERFMDELTAAIRTSRHPERIVLTGFQNDLAPYLAAADIVCLTSRTEGQSKIIPQAFAMRKLVVASKTGGIPELVRHGINGILYKKGDPKALAHAIHEALSRDTAPMKAAAFKTAQSLEIAPLMQRTEQLYASVTSEKVAQCG